MLRVQYDTPNVRPLVYEWRDFHDHVTTRTQPASSAADFRHDLELFAQMIDLMAAKVPAA